MKLWRTPSTRPPLLPFGISRHRPQRNLTAQPHAWLSLEMVNVDAQQSLGLTTLLPMFSDLLAVRAAIGRNTLCCRLSLQCLGTFALRHALGERHHVFPQ